MSSSFWSIIGFLSFFDWSPLLKCWQHNAFATYTCFFEVLILPHVKRQLTAMLDCLVTNSDKMLGTKVTNWTKNGWTACVMRTRLFLCSWSGRSLEECYKRRVSRTFFTFDFVKMSGKTLPGHEFIFASTRHMKDRSPRSLSINAYLGSFPVFYVDTILWWFCNGYWLLKH